MMDDAMMARRDVVTEKYQCWSLKSWLNVICSQFLSTDLSRQVNSELLMLHDTPVAFTK